MIITVLIQFITCFCCFYNTSSEQQIKTITTTSYHMVPGEGGLVKGMSYEKKDFFDKQGNVLKKINSHKVQESKYIYKRGKLKKEQWYGHIQNPSSRKRKIKTVKYTYNSKGLLQQKKEKDLIKKRIKTTSYLWENGLLVEKQMPQDSTNIQYFYEDELLVKEIKNLYAKNVLQCPDWTTTYSYHQNGILKTSFQRGKCYPPKDNKRQSTTEVTESFNEKGLKVKHTYYNDGIRVNPNVIYRYKYDKHGNWIECTTYTRSKYEYSGIKERVIEYYNK